MSDMARLCGPKARAVCRKRGQANSFLASVAAFGLGTYLRQFDADSRMANDEDDVYEGLRWDVYRSRGFLKGLLLASVPLSLSEHFNDVSDHIDIIFRHAFPVSRAA